MDDEHICPLCCEELDISDRNFFPCKCGYQVCMWCWHRIRSEASDNEKALCPACRTPYGDDPHEFSALDIADVIKANKQKAKEEKKERERRMMLQEQAMQSGVGGHQQQQLVMSEQHFPSLADGSSALGAVSSYSSSHNHDAIHTSSTGTSHSIPTIVVSNSSKSSHHHDHFKGGDRSSLANMRVIRRNLVYAVGLPPSVANEELLKKPEYFGGYGKISKIVLNRSNISGGNVDNGNRRASASAYVTFAHKEDTLSCILALDGFYLDNRNIRASYGTSKYCSAFIKNVRCNNPDCTYLHELGDEDDTFTKQEIQAGYVTSGRDVLAKQQQQLVSLTGSNTGKRRVGGGGPSGTGRVSSNPVFPPPTYDEPEKPQPRVRAVSGGISRTSSLPSSATHSLSSGSSSVSNIGLNNNVSEINESKPPVRAITAASIVASSVGSTQPKPAPSSKPTLTPLKPVQRSVSLPVASSKQSEASMSSSSKMKVNALPIGNTSGASISGSAIGSSLAHDALNQQAFGFGNLNGSNTAGSASLLNAMHSVSEPSIGLTDGLHTRNGKIAGKGHNPSASFGSVGSEISGLSLSAPFDAPIGSIAASVSNENGAESGKQWNSSGVSTVNGNNDISSSKLNHNNGQSNNIWGAVGSSAAISSPWATPAPPIEGTTPFSSNAVIGSLGSSKQVPMETNQQSSLTNGSFGTGNLLGSENGGLWSNSGNITTSGMVQSSNNISNSSFLNQTSSKDIGGLGQNPFSTNHSGSSALASMLGISLPTGSGSLREISNNRGLQSSDPFNSSTSSLATPIGHSQANSSLLWNDTYAQPLTNSGGNSGSMAVGSSMASGTIGSLRGNVMNGTGDNNGSDVAMLQNLLPGVHITSGNAKQPAHPSWGGSQTWNTGPLPSGNEKKQNHEQNDPWGADTSLYGSNDQASMQNKVNGRGIW